MMKIANEHDIAKLFDVVKESGETAVKVKPKKTIHKSAAQIKAVSRQEGVNG
jgi:hypothetical protein